MKKITLNTLNLTASNMLSNKEKRNVLGGFDWSVCGDMIVCDCTYSPDGSIASYKCCPSDQIHRACMI